MTLDEFIKNYEGKQIDYDGAYGSQCVDVFRQYAKEVLGIKEHTGAVEGAKDLFLKFNEMPLMQKYYKKAYTPQKGDIVIFGENKTNKYGHVAIVIYATNKSIIVFEQDGFNQNKGAYISIWDYERVLGFLRRK